MINRYLYSSVVLLILVVSTSFAQLNRPIYDANDPSIPAWVKMMFSDNVNVRQVDSAYTAYYKTHPFVKNHFTRYYRRWRHSVEPFVLADGSIKIRTADELETLYRPKNNSQHQTASDIWTPFKMETFFPENDTACPWQVNVYGIDISLSDPNVLVCATEPGSIFRTTDKGKNWSLIGKDYSLGSESVSIHPTDPNTIYIGTYNAFRTSTDGGAEWRTTYTNTDLTTNDIEIHPTQPNIILAATSKGLIRSTDNGTSWNTSYSNSSCELEVHPTKRNIIYSLAYNPSNARYECWKSSDFGATFTPKLTGWYADSSTGAGRMTVTPADPDRVYVVLLTQKGPRIIRSNDAGETWFITAAGGSDSLAMDNWQGFYDLGIVASHTNADDIIVGTASAYKSTDGGKHFTILGGYGGNFPIHPDVQEMKAIGNETWIATDGGITLSTDFFTDTKNAVALNHGVFASDFWGFDIGWNEDVMVGGRYHNGNTALHENYNGKWMRMGGAESPTGYVNPMFPRITYFSDIGAYEIPDSFENKFTYIPIAKYPNESYFQMWYSIMRWDPRYANVIWIGNKNTLYKSTTGGARYDAVFSDPDTNALIQHIEISRSNPDVMYFTSHNSAADLYRSSDGGKTWKRQPQPPTVSGGQLRTSMIAVSGTNENELWWALRSGNGANKILHSKDGGATWSNMTTLAIKDISIGDMVHQLGTDGGIYLSCDGGLVYYRNNSMTEWASYGAGLPINHYTRAIKPFYRDGKLRIGSSVGAWEAPMYEPSKPLAQPMVDKLLSECPRDTFFFEDYSALKHEGASWQWDFPGASYVSSTSERNPKVVYSAPGKYNVTLTITQGSQTNSKTVQNMVEVRASQCDLEHIAGLAADLSKDSTEYISVPALPIKSNTVTIMCWVKPKGIQRDWAAIYQTENASGFGFRAGENELEYHWDGAGYSYNFRSGLFAPADEWSHVALVVTPTAARLYLNGEESENFVGHGAVDFSLSGARIGQDRTYGVSRNFDGEVDEFAFYDRALTIDEIRKSLHLIHKPDEQGLKLYYQFNEQGSEQTYDRIGRVHASGSARTLSTAPVAEGAVDLQYVNDGTFDFPSVGVELRSGNRFGIEAGQYGIFKLFASPDSLPSGMSKFTETYWILHRWSVGGLVRATDTLIFKNIGEMSANDEANLGTNFHLFNRGVNGHRNNWADMNKSSLLDALGMKNSLWYQYRDSIVRTGQYVIGTTGDSPLDVTRIISQMSGKIVITPNPTHDVVAITYYPKQHDRTAMLTLINSLGAELLREPLNMQAGAPITRTVDLTSYARGVYWIRIGSSAVLLVKE